MKYLVALALLAFVHSSAAQLVSWEEFSNAATWAGYPTPQSDQYNAFQANIHKAFITTKQEAAMAFTHFLWESDGLQAMREYACAQTGCPGSYETSGCDVGGQRYYGRGYIQLTWCYNYRQASAELYGSDWLVHAPDNVATDQNVAWDTAFWFWRTNVHYQSGVAGGAFGATTRAINGDLECDGDQQDTARHRFQMYKTVLQAFGLDPNGAVEGGCYN